MVRTRAGRGTSRTVIAVAIPNIPSLPTKAPTRSGPHASPPGLPSRTISPVGSATSSSRTWLVVTPYLRQCGPPAFSATLPPMVQAVWLDGSGAYINPNGAAARLSDAFTTPGSTTARRLAGSSSRMRPRRVRVTSTAGASPRAPPDRPVPAPRATKGTRRRCSAASTRLTSPADPGNTTSAGVRRSVGSPSDANVASSARSVRTKRAPTIRDSSSARSACSMGMRSNVASRL